MSLNIKKRVISYEYDSFKSNLQNIRELKGQEWLVKTCDKIIDDWSKNGNRGPDNNTINIDCSSRSRLSNKSRPRELVKV